MRHVKSERFHQLLQEIAALHDKKSADYGSEHDPFNNIASSKQWGVRPCVGALIRLTDKVHRLQTWATTGTLQNEGAEDSLRDIAAYALIALVELELESEVTVTCPK